SSFFFHTMTQSQKKEDLEFLTKNFLAKFYLKEDLSPYQRWHDKLGHVGRKALKKCEIKGLKMPKVPFRCEACIQGKIHKLGRTPGGPGEIENYLPGEYIITDLRPLGSNTRWCQV